MKKLARLLALALMLSACGNEAVETVPETTAAAITQPAVEPETEPTAESSEQRLLFTFAGDCTLGCHKEHNRAGYGFLLTVGEDFVLCILAAMLAKRLIPAFQHLGGV